MTTKHAFDALEAAAAIPPCCVLFGDEPFLRQVARKALLERIGDDEPFVTRIDGQTAAWREVADELATRSLFGQHSRRVVVVEQADQFVSEHRSRLEDYVQKPRAASVLVLEVTTWPSNTRLYKSLDASGLQIECRAPHKSAGSRKVLDQRGMLRWITDWARRQHELRLEPAASELLLELVGPEFGILDQELAKLAALFGQVTINVEQVGDAVGGWRTKTIWELLDAAAEGHAAEALRQLDRLLQAGEHPVALLGQMAWSLRRLAAATRHFEESERKQGRGNLREALLAAGFPHWNREAMTRAEKQLRQLGRERAAGLYRQLLEADLALKGSHSSPDRARLVLERLVVEHAGSTT